jgi:SAM-dependent methyltransferase
MSPACRFHYLLEDDSNPKTLVAAFARTWKFRQRFRTLANAATLLKLLLQKLKNMTTSILRRGNTRFVFLFGFSLLAGSAVGESNSAHPGARAVTEGLHGGVVVHVGCEYGGNTLKLGQAGAWLVRGLERDPDKIRAARKRIVDAGRYGPVSVAEWCGDVLPFVDNSIDVILLDGGAEVALEECTRALRPGGRVCFQEGGTLGGKLSSSARRIPMSGRMRFTMRAAPR